MKTHIATLLLLMLLSTITQINVKAKGLSFHPIEHASFIIKHNQLTIYVDPVGDIENYKSFPKPDIILITHIHGDHFNKDLIEGIKSEKTTIIGNEKSIETLGYGKKMQNGDTTESEGIMIEAIPMYNTTPERMNYHPRGDGNGYVLTLDNERVYISGDTEDITEMRALKNIDHAFLCMNLPYTMNVEQAASAVLEFKPKYAYPYHYRERNGKADINKFKDLVVAGSNTKVVFLKWYNE